MRKLAFQAASIALIALSWCCQKTLTQPPASLRALRPIPPSVAEVPPREMRQALAASYRLKPDRRLLLAIGELHHFLSNLPAEEPAVEFKDSGWEIRYRGESVGQVPEFPDFADFEELLAGWTKRLNERYPLQLTGVGTEPLPAEIQRKLDGFFVADVTAGLRQIDSQWSKGKHEAMLLPAALRGFVSLLIEGYDQMEVADRVAGKALALLALTRNLTSYQPDREECLLAKSMGYATRAEWVAATFPEADPARLYVLRDDARLKQMATTGGSAETRYLWLIRLAWQGEPNAWFGAATALFPREGKRFELFRAGMDLNSFDILEQFPSQIAAGVQNEIAQARGPVTLLEAVQAPRTWGIAYLAQVFRSKPSPLAPKLLGAGVELLAQSDPGPFLDPETFRSYYRAYYLSSLYEEGIFYLDHLSSGPDAGRFATSRAAESKGTLAEDFSVWYKHLADSLNARGNPQLLADDLIGLASLGAAPLMRTFQDIKNQVAYEPLALTAVRRLAARMDTRVSDRFEMGNLAYHTLFDLPLSEKLYGSVLKAAGSQYFGLAGWYARQLGDVKQLTALLDVPGRTAWERAQILEELADQKGLSPDILRNYFERTIEANPESWYLREKYVAYLEKRKDYESARRVIEPWLAAQEDTSNLEYVTARTALARQLYLEGHYPEAWDAIRSVIGSWQAGAMQRAAMILNRMGRRAEAEKLQRLDVERYPDSVFQRTVLAQFYWEWGRPKDAAAVLRAAPRPLSIDDWEQTAAPKFVETFAERPKEDALAAFSDLQAGGMITEGLERVCNKISEARKDDTAFQMVGKLHGGNFRGDLIYRIDGYKYLKALKGARPALAWLRTAIPPSSYPAMSMAAFNAGEYDLLWDFVDNSQQGEDQDFGWLVRAAGSVKLLRGKDTHRAELTNYFREHTRGLEAATGRYLLGLATEDEVFAQMHDPHDRSQVYFLGLLAESEGRLRDASDWYRISIETGGTPVHNIRVAWAYDRLSDWEAKGMSLERIAAASR